MVSLDSCVRCGFGDDKKHGPLVVRQGMAIHWFRCLNPKMEMPAKDEEPVEAATAAPGEVRGIHVPVPTKHKQRKRPPREFK